MRTSGHIPCDTPSCSESITAYRSEVNIGERWNIYVKYIREKPMILQEQPSRS